MDWVSPVLIFPMPIGSGRLVSVNPRSSGSSIWVSSLELKKNSVLYFSNALIRINFKNSFTSFLGLNDLNSTEKISIELKSPERIDSTDFNILIMKLMIELAGILKLSICLCVN